MRVYGSSPLYNYVELVFRSRRLFIGSIIVATVAAVALYFMRASNYTARTLILLVGTTAASPNNPAERGTIQFKANVLSLCMRDPKWIKEALRADGYDRGMDAMQFDAFAKNVKDKVSYGISDNVLEIACTWPDERADKFVNTIFGAYKRTLLEQEDAASTTNTELMKDLLAEYRHKRNELEKTVADYTQNHVLTGLNDDPGPASSQYQQALNDLRRVNDEKELAKERFNLLKTQFDKTPKTYQENVVRLGAGKDPGYAAAATQLEDAKKDLSDLKARFTDIHPLVKQAQAKVDALTKEVGKYTGTSTNVKAKGPISTETESANPQWITLDNQVKAEEVNMNQLDKQLAQAQANLELARQRALKSPAEQYNFRRMTDDLGLYTTIQGRLAGDVEEAKIAEERDKAYNMSDIKQQVKPESEKENKGAKGLLMLAAGPLVGIIIAFAFSLLAESMDHSLRTPLDIEKQLGKPVLAVLPRIKAGQEGSRRKQLGGEAARPTLPAS